MHARRRQRLLGKLGDGLLILPTAAHALRNGDVHHSFRLEVMGRSLNSYTVYVGGSHVGTRLARLLADNVPAAELGPLIGRLIDHWRRQRHDGEAFGDFCDRMGAKRLQPQVNPAVSPAAPMHTGGFS